MESLDAENAERGVATVYPSFMRAFRDELEPSIVTGLDGWEPERSGTWEEDVAQGGRYAELAVRFASEQRNPDFIAFVLTAILAKTRDGLIVPGGVEFGFTSRLARLAYCGAHN